MFDFDVDIQTVAATSLAGLLIALFFFLAKDVKRDKFLSFVFSALMISAISIAGAIFVVTMCIQAKLVLWSDSTNLLL